MTEMVYTIKNQKKRAGLAYPGGGVVGEGWSPCGGRTVAAARRKKARKASMASICAASRAESTCAIGSIAVVKRSC